MRPSSTSRSFERKNHLVRKDIQFLVCHLVITKSIRPALYGLGVIISGPFAQAGVRAPIGSGRGPLIAGSRAPICANYSYKTCLGSHLEIMSRRGKYHFVKIGSLGDVPTTPLYGNLHYPLNDILIPWVLGVPLGPRLIFLLF